MSKKKGLPKTIFVVQKTNPSSEEWFDLTDSVEELAEIGETTEVGVYQLVKTQKVKGVVEIT